METAIKQAIEGGYMCDKVPQDALLDNWDTLKTESIYLDPLFWQALGKAEGWKDTEIQLPWKMNLEYMRQWHHFIDHLADGGTPDEFFEKLLTKQN